MKKKINKLQIVRIIMQIVFLILLPELFALTFSQLGQLYSMIIKGEFTFTSAFTSATAVLSIIPLTIIFGRFFCGWMCAFGAFTDFLYIVSKKIFKTKFKISEKLDANLKYIKYIVLIFTMIFMWTIGSTIFSSASPWNAFAQISQFSLVLSDYTIGLIILILIAVGNMFIERFFCRYLCPLGAVFSIVSKIRLFKINKPNDKCNKCKLCTCNCAMGIPLYKVNKVTSGECINCLKCLETCPRGNTQMEVLNEKITPELASSIAVAALISVYSMNNVLAAKAMNNNIISYTGVLPSPANNQSSSSTNTENTPSSSSQLSTVVSPSAPASTVNKVYKDGTYTGTAVGYKPGLTVSVTVKSDKITKIEITAINDTPNYYQKPVSLIPQEIIKTQSTKVDAVSGATRTSVGIMKAVEAALNNAKL